MSHPYFLDRGIWLEDREQLLEWGTPIVELPYIPVTDYVVKNENGCHCSWSDRVFGGLDFRVLTDDSKCPFFRKVFLPGGSWALLQTFSREFGEPEIIPVDGISDDDGKWRWQLDCGIDIVLFDYAWVGEGAWIVKKES